LSFVKSAALKILLFESVILKEGIVCEFAPNEKDRATKQNEIDAANETQSFFITINKI